MEPLSGDVKLMYETVDRTRVDSHRRAPDEPAKSPVSRGQVAEILARQVASQINLISHSVG